MWNYVVEEGTAAAKLSSDAPGKQEGHGQR